MKKLFLTSSVASVAKDIAKKLDLSKNNKLVFINTAAEPEMKSDPENMQWLADDRQALVDVGFEVTDYTIAGKSKDQLKDDLKIFDYIYLSGGDTLHLLKESKKSGFVKLIKDFILNQGKIYIGTSAGSIIAGDKCPDYLLGKEDVLELNDKKGYGLVNFTMLPHWGSDDFKDLYFRGRLEIAYKEDQVPLLFLTDNQYVYVENDKFEIIDVGKKK